MLCGGGVGVESQRTLRTLGGEPGLALLPVGEGQAPRVVGGGGNEGCGPAGSLGLE